MIQMKAPTKFLIFPSLAILIVSCTTISYVPKVSLDLSPKTINKFVQVDRFTDVSPSDDKMNPFMGLSVTGQESLASELDLEVTNAVIADFSANRLFEKVGRKVENPNLIIKGEIKRFYGKFQYNAFARVSSVMGTVGAIGSLFTPWAALACLPELVWFFGVPVSTNTSEVVIEMKIYDNNYNLINTYTGKSIDFISASMYRDKSLQVPTMTNKTFTKAIMQIRDQILADTDKFD